MKIALVIVTDGRQQYMSQCLDHLRANLPYFFGDDEEFGQRIIVDDSGDENYKKWLDEVAPEFVILHHPQRQGMAEAVNTGWHAALILKDTKFVFHVEEDFLIYPGVDVEAMADTLRHVPWLASLTLKRQAWSNEEHMAGGQIPLTEQITGQRCEEVAVAWGDETPTAVHSFVRHRHLFSLNPSLIPRRVIAMGWPSGPLGVGNESGMTEKLLANDYAFAYWGRRDDPPLCEHIGYQRSAGWQL